MGLSYYQYFYLNKKRNKNDYLLFLLRFLTYTTIGVLLLNPKMQTTTTSVQKRNLVVLVDNSSSIKRLGDTTKIEDFYNTIFNDELLNQKFKVEGYSFGDEFKVVDTIDYTEHQTKIYEALEAVDQIYDLNQDLVVVISDGNQTVGLDYSQYGAQQNATIFPVVVGDTVPKFDTKIDLVNVNNYSFLNNLFPIEVFVSYNGKKSVPSQLQLFQDNKLIKAQEISFDANKSSQEVQFLIKANQVGLQLYNLVLKPVKDEKFIANNTFQFGVEVIDESAKILIATSVLHPDVGMWKRSIETNKQRKVDVKLVGEEEIDIDLYQAVLFYQPTLDFENIIQKTKEKGLGTLTITGTKTDYTFLNTIQDKFKKEIVPTTEDYYSNYNSNFSTFQFEDIGFSNFPPLEDQFGQVRFNDAHQVLLYQKVQGVSTKSPMLFSYSTNSTKHVVLFGENSWRWRSQFYTEQQNFKDFDSFLSALIQYISSSDFNQRMIVDSSNFYNEGENSQIAAKYYDANYKPLTDAELNIRITETTTNTVQQFPMLLQEGKFVFNTAGLSPGEYSYEVVENTSNIKKQGQFKILSYSVENQFISPNLNSLIQLSNTNELFYINQVELLKAQLLQSPEYNPILSVTKNNQSLINSFYLFFFLALTLFLEWFLRKYQGLI